MKRAVLPLLALALAGLYAAAISAMWIVGTREAEEKTENLLDYAIIDFKDTVNGALDTLLVNAADGVARETAVAKRMGIGAAQALADRYGVDEVNIISREGDFLASSDPLIAGKSVTMLDREETAGFMVLTGGAVRVYSQKFRRGAHTDGARRKYLGVAYPGGEGFVQVGLNESRLAEGLYETLLGFIFDEWLVGETGCFLCADPSGRLFSNPSRHRNEAKTLAETGFTPPDPSVFDPSREREDQTFTATVFGEECFCREFVFADHTLLAVVPEREYYSTRNVNFAVAALALAAVLAVFLLLIYRIWRDARRLKAFYDAEAAARAKDFAIAGTIQSAALPAEFPESPYFAIAAAMTPAKEVGGDFYDFFALDATHEAFLVADVSGKGTPAALYMMTAKTLIRDTLLAKRDPAAALTAVNAELCGQNPANMFITAWVGVMDLETGRVSFVNAGHNPPFARRGDGTVEMLKERSGPILAYMDGVSYGLKSVELKPGDTLFLYTDGVTEAMDASGALFGDERLAAALGAGMSADSPESVCTVVRAAVAAFAAGAPAADDLTVLAVRFRERAAREVRTFPPSQESVADASAYLDGALEAGGCGAKTRRELAIILDEVASNIVKYSGATAFSVDVKFFHEKRTVRVIFSDDGTAYDPLARQDPDTSLSADERQIGGLGILMVKHLAEAVRYERRLGRNILIVDKTF
ncbi:MAG: SpoIIE family protein phosphatase [Kiritimatiellae bacterium]|nr:SpoIIE family protein phosphatase [Kiritimatiellia bacterium]